MKKKLSEQEQKVLLKLRGQTIVFRENEEKRMATLINVGSSKALIAINQGLRIIDANSIQHDSW